MSLALNSKTQHFDVIILVYRTAYVCGLKIGWFLEKNVVASKFYRTMSSKNRLIFEKYVLVYLYVSELFKYLLIKYYRFVVFSISRITQNYMF